MSRLSPPVAILFAALASTAGVPARAVERPSIPDKYKWNLTDLYPSVDAWAAAKQDIAKRLSGLDRFKGRLGESANTFADALDYMMDLDRDLSRLNTYASQLSDEDVRISRHVAMRQEARQLAVAANTAGSFMRPEILALGRKKVDAFVAAEARLKSYRPWLDDILRWAPHTLDPPEEKIVARAGLMSHAGGEVRDVFTNAEMPYPEVTLSTGETVRLDAQGYTRYRALPNREDREKVFQAFWKIHQEYKGTLGAALDAQVHAHIFYRDVRKFSSCLESAMFGSNIPVQVYQRLIDDTRANLPTLHRYLKLRRRMMGLDTLRYEDLYAPVIKEVDLHYTPEEATKLVLAALAPLGQAYVDTLRHGLESGWVDWLPSTGKASGAYSTGAYGVHPYQLQNFTGLYEEVGTLAHESGHSMHTFLADEHQPYVTHDYTTFVAEVASTLNENLLFHYMLDHTNDRETRLFLLGSYLDNLRGTLFRQTLFAEFERAIHEKAEGGETLTGENLNGLYLGIVRAYYGHDQGVCLVDETYGAEWAYVDHFFYNFYVYQYATSVVASTAIANGIREEAAKGGHARLDAYLGMLAAGSSRYPIDLLEDAGVDMTTSAPFEAAMREMNAVMDEIEKLLDS